MATTLFIAADHGGLALKEEIKTALKKSGTTLVDLGTDSTQSVDYPDFAHRLAEKMKSTPNSEGILICGSGIGMSIAANRHAWIRAALVTTPEMAKLAREHNNANVLVLGGRMLKMKEALKLVESWLKATYEGGRHDRRLEKL